MIGIDRYRSWSPLHNAVADARGARKAFARLGFNVLRELVDEAATYDALHHLVKDDLCTLGRHDSLVLFFAGHGHTLTSTFSEGPPSKSGYLIPFDGEPPDGYRVGSWLNLNAWLSDIAHLPPTHILVILDACHSGIALDRVARWRGKDTRINDPWERLRERRSRRVITSALDTERALDTGPLQGHSLFTGCLIEALTGGLAARRGSSFVTGSEIGIHVQRRVIEYPNWKQTPDFGALELDNRGELIVNLDISDGISKPVEQRPRPTEIVRGPGGSRRIVGGREPKPFRDDKATPRPLPSVEAPSRPSDPALRIVDPASRTEGLQLDRGFAAALDRHHAERTNGSQVLSVLTGDAMEALTSWATWAAGHGSLTLVTEGASRDQAITELLAQFPWLRCLTAARMKLATAARLHVDEIDAALDARSNHERQRWIDNSSRFDRDARVAGWLLSALRQTSASAPDPSTSPVQGGELLSSLCKLAAPFTVLVHNPKPDVAWVERAVATAADLTEHLPAHAIAVSATEVLLGRVLAKGHESAALAMARQGIVRVPTGAQLRPGRARSRTAQVLHDALGTDPRTKGRFELNARLPIPEGPTVDVDLVAKSARLAVELDGWYHFPDPQAYKSERIKDSRLQSAGFFVMRFLSEDVDERVELVVEQIAVGLASRRRAGA